jgi:hypothetical protein
MNKIAEYIEKERNDRQAYEAQKNEEDIYIDENIESNLYTTFAKDFVDLNIITEKKGKLLLKNTSEEENERYMIDDIKSHLEVHNNVNEAAPLFKDNKIDFDFIEEAQKNIKTLFDIAIDKNNKALSYREIIERVEKLKKEKYGHGLKNPTGEQAEGFVEALSLYLNSIGIVTPLDLKETLDKKNGIPTLLNKITLIYDTTLKAKKEYDKAGEEIEGINIYESDKSKGGTSKDYFSIVSYLNSKPHVKQNSRINGKMFSAIRQPSYLTRLLKKLSGKAFETKEK